MGIRATVAWLVLLVCGCYSPQFTRCPDVDCPIGEVCDNHGGCAFPQQLAPCAGQSDGTSCAYTDQTGKAIDGTCQAGLCVPLACGDGVLTSDEVCDDGNNLSGDGCSADCKSLEICGNGITDSAKGEQCDDGNTVDGDGCQHDCKLPRCGDGITDTQLDEQCDAGGSNSDTPDAPCRTNCQLPRCGDHIVDVTNGEVCDDGNNASADGCSGDCKSNETCGNGIVDALAGEVCDDGNTTAGDGCSADCRSIEVCGNGVVDVGLGEVCDDGNTVSGDGCSSDCRSKEVCGNGIVDTIDEQCDLGGLNSDLPDHPCRTTCKLQACGDGIVDPGHGEHCDNGAANSTLPDACRPNCELPRCGDGIKDSTEICDDGNTTSGDGCSSDCHSLELCGNGVIDTAMNEQCDNGTANSNAPNATCRTDCTRQKCGDSIIDNVFGELCDNGLANSNLPDAACRVNCTPMRCGDAIKDTGEVCDDGNVTAGDGCSADCKSNETCGNGIIDVIRNEQCDNAGLNSNAPNATCRLSCQRQKCGDSIVDNAFGETCDLGTANSDSPNATCRSNCTLARCGDHIVDPAAGEVCDDGNNTSGDGCSGDCKSLETCGNGIVDIAKGEQCDDGNTVNNDTCHNDCTLPRCGDGVLDFNEQCDAGAANSNLPNATCRTNCTPARCGDGIIDTARGEVCDDSNTTAGDGCSADCTSNETCGNGVVDLVKGEQCDDGNKRGRDGCSACKIEREVAVKPGGTPVGRHSEVLVYDAGRQRVVMFGGYTLNGELNDTWEWDGTSWTQVFPAHSPIPRFDAAAAYDPVRHRIVIFGGYSLNYGGALQDTWEYDGVDWTAKTFANPPSDRAGAAMAFDANAGKLVMFGGAIGFSGGTPSGMLAETWTYDGTSWALQNPTTKPSARAGARMVFDSANKILLMFGGRDSSTGANNHMWKWSGGNWTDAGAASGPYPDYDADGLAFDANIGKVVAWDGTSGSTWEWSGTAWTTISGTTPPVPTTSPTFRGYISMTYDAVRKQVVLFGGAQGTAIPAFGIPVYGDTWVRTGQAWTSPPAFAEPSARVRAAAGYDPLRRRVVVFGGQTAARRKAGCGASGCMIADTWEWDGIKWNSVGASTPPAVRAGDQLDYDTSARVLRLYGGDSYSSTGPTDTTYTDVYSYNGASWTPQSSAGHTTVRGSSMAYDANANALVTFGGVVVANGTASNETWTWSSTGGWVKLTPATTPTARDDSALAYDPVRKRSVMFSGNPRDGSNLTDVYELDSSTASWSRFTTAGPASRRGHRAFYNPDSARVTFFGNNPGASEDIWEWGTAGWQHRALANTVPPRYQAAVAYDAANHAIVMFAGRDAGTFAPVAGTTLIKSQSNVTVEACTSAALDYDGDGLAGCADDDCWSVCTPLCPPGVTCPAGAPRCGDGTCSGFEDCNLCPTDCGACTGGKCGDFHCDGTESHSTCPNDC